MSAPVLWAGRQPPGDVSPGRGESSDGGEAVGEALSPRPVLRSPQRRCDGGVDDPGWDVARDFEGWADCCWEDAWEHHSPCYCGPVRGLHRVAREVMPPSVRSSTSVRQHQVEAAEGVPVCRPHGRCLPHGDPTADTPAGDRRDGAAAPEKGSCGETILFAGRAATTPHGDPSIHPSFVARNAASTRLRTPSFRKISWMWDFTVFSLRCTRSAISRLE